MPPTPVSCRWEGAKNISFLGDRCIKLSKLLIINKVFYKSNFA